MADYPDFEGAKSKLFSVADWAALQATDKNFTFLKLSAATGEYAETTYTVPSGKTLYITQVAFDCFGISGADRDQFQICRFALYVGTAAKITIGGNGGGGLALTKPYVFTEGTVILAYVSNKSGHTATVEGYFGGYEI